MLRNDSARPAGPVQPRGAFVLYLEGPGDRGIVNGWCRRLLPAQAGSLARSAVILGGKRPARAVEHFRSLGGASSAFGCSSLESNKPSIAFWASKIDPSSVLTAGAVGVSAMWFSMKKAARRRLPKSFWACFAKRVSYLLLNSPVITNDSKCCFNSVRFFKLCQAFSLAVISSGWEFSQVSRNLCRRVSHASLKMGSPSNAFARSSLANGYGPLLDCL